MKRKNKGFLLQLLSVGALLAQYPKGIVEIAKLKSAMYCLRIVQGVRRGYIILFQLAFCALFLLMGVILMHVALFFLLTNGVQMKMGILFGAGFVEFAGALAFITWFLSSKRWLDESAKWNSMIGKKDF